MLEEVKDPKDLKVTKVELEVHLLVLMEVVVLLVSKVNLEDQVLKDQQDQVVIHNLNGV
jgi:hypothetical protein